MRFPVSEQPGTPWLFRPVSLGLRGAKEITPRNGHVLALIGQLSAHQERIFLALEGMSRDLHARCARQGDDSPQPAALDRTEIEEVIGGGVLPGDEPVLHPPI